MNRDEKILLAITGLSHLSVHVLMLIFPAILIVMQNQFALGLDQLGFIVAISAFMFGLGAIPAGYFESRLGGRNLLLIYLLGTGLVSVSMLLVDSIINLTLLLGLLGLFASIYHPAGLTLISRRVKHLSKGMAFHGIAGSTGLAIGPFYASILSETYSWKMPYLIIGIVNFILALVVLIVVPILYKKRSEEAKIEINTNKQGLFYYYGFTIISGFVFGGFTTFMPTYFAQETQSILPWISPVVKGGLFTSIVFSAGAIGQVIGGYTGARYPKPMILMWVALLNIPVLILMGMTSGLILIFISLFLGIFYFVSQPVGNALLADLTQDGHRGLGYGISFFLSFGVGGISAAFSGWLAEIMNTSMVFIFMGIALFPAAYTWGK